MTFQHSQRNQSAETMANQVHGPLPDRFGERIGVLIQRAPDRRVAKPTNFPSVPDQTMRQRPKAHRAVPETVHQQHRSPVRAAR